MPAVRVPATSANLGCAFDCAALALDLHLVAEASPRTGPGFDVTCQGEGASSVPRDATNLVIRGIDRVAGWAGKPVPGFHLLIRSRIPVGSGLGSSAAAIVAGLLLGEELCGSRLDQATLIGLAAELEGHPDNVAAAFRGGLVVAAALGRSGGVLTRKAQVPSDLLWVAVVPETPMPTAQGRAVLPASYSRADAVHNLQRACLLIASAFSGEFRFQPEFFADRWHQASRVALVPGLAECLALEHPDLLGVFLSGSGSTVLAVARASAPEIAEQLLERFRSQGVEARALTLAGDNAGATRLPGPEPAPP